MKIRSRIGPLLAAGVLGVGAAIAVAAPASADDYGPYHMVHQSSLCLEDPSHVGAQGSQLRLNVCSSSWLDDWQFFTFTNTISYGPNTYLIRPSSHLNMCLQPGAPSLYGSTIILWPCANFTPREQAWFFGATSQYPWFYAQNLYGSQWVLSTASPAVVGSYVRQYSVNEPNRDWKLASL